MKSANQFGFCRRCGRKNVDPQFECSLVACGVAWTVLTPAPSILNRALPRQGAPKPNFALNCRTSSSSRVVSERGSVAVEQMFVVKVAIHFPRRSSIRLYHFRGAMWPQQGRSPQVTTPKTRLSKTAFQSPTSLRPSGWRRFVTSRGIREMMWTPVRSG